MHLAVLVINGDVLLETFCNRLVVNDYLRFSSKCSGNDLDYVQKFSGIPATIPEKCLCFKHFNVSGLEDDIFFQSPVKQFLQILGNKGLKHEYLTSRQKGSDDLERRILSSGSNQNNCSVLHGAKQGILL